MEEISKDALWAKLETTASNSVQDEETPSPVQKQLDDPPVAEGAVVESKELQIPPESSPKPGGAKLAVSGPAINVEPEDEEVKNGELQTETKVLAEKEGEVTLATEVPQEKEVSIAKLNTQNFHLDQAEPLLPDSFPNPPSIGSSSIPATIPNLRHLLTEYGVVARYNVIKKKIQITLPGVTGTSDNQSNVALSYVHSLATLNRMGTGQISKYIVAVGDHNLYNPVADWITSKPWDGIDRLQALYDTLTHQEDFPWQLKEILMYRWLLSAVAAAFEKSGFRCRGVFTLQGPQSIGKTAWIAALVSDALLREQLILQDHHLDASSKDSLLSAVSHWVVELGEVDSSFKKDMARLKGFLTSNIDKVRRPYGYDDSEYPRRTVFAASVNEKDFLVDMTGNTRWWTIPVTAINYNHGIDMQQLFAQVLIDYRKGEKWWLTSAEEQCLEKYNKEHRKVSAIEERVMPILDLNLKDEEGLPAMTASELLIRVGYKTVSNSQAKECGTLLRQHLGEPKKINGYQKWRIPFAKQTNITRLDDEY